MSLIPFMTRFVFDYVFTRHRYIEYFPRLKQIGVMAANCMTVCFFLPLLGKL